MLKKALIIVSVVAVLLLVSLTYILGRSINQEEIMRAKLEMQQLRSSRDSIKAVVSLKDSIQSLLRIQVNQLNMQANTLRKQVDQLEEDRAKEQLTVRKIHKKKDLQDKLVKTFPEMAQSDWGVTEVYNEENQIGIEYLLIPLWFSETFIIDHQNSLSYLKQRDKLLTVDSLRQTVDVLQDSLFTLEQQKANAYKAGYDEAYAKYEALNEDYVQLLKHPPSIKLGFPKWGVVAAGVGAGVLIGTQIK